MNFILENSSFIENFKEKKKTRVSESPSEVKSTQSLLDSVREMKKEYKAQFIEIFPVESHNIIYQCFHPCYTPLSEIRAS